MNNKKSYKDYKYVYTGYKDYCKKHKIETEKKLSNNKKETIIHDHRFKYDFNNPTQHQHDYSFDFNNPNEHYHDYSFDFSQNPQPQNKTANKKTYYTNTYNTKNKTSTAARPMATTARPTSIPAKSTTSASTPRYNTQTTNTMYAYNKKKTQTSSIPTPIKLFIFFTIILPILISILSIFFEIFNGIYDYKVEEEYSINENYTNINPDLYYNDQYDNVTNTFCNALRTGSYDVLSPRITYEENRYNNGKYWNNIINSYPSSYRSSISCTQFSSIDYTEQQINNIEDAFYDTYDEKIEITEAKYVNLTVKYNIYQDYQTTKYHSIVVGRINNKWYLINT